MKKYYININTCSIDTDNKNILYPIVVNLTQADKDTLTDYFKSKTVLQAHYDINDRNTQKNILNNDIDIIKFLLLHLTID